MPEPSLPHAALFGRCADRALHALLSAGRPPERNGSSGLHALDAALKSATQTGITLTSDVKLSLTFCGAVELSAWVWVISTATLSEPTEAREALLAEAQPSLELARHLAPHALGVVWLLPSPRLTPYELMSAEQRARALLAPLNIPQAQLAVVGPREGADLLLKHIKRAHAQKARSALEHAPHSNPTPPTGALSPHTLDALVPLQAGTFEGVEAQRWEAPQPLAFAQTLLTRALYEELMGPAPSLGEPLPSLPFGAPQVVPVSDGRLPVSKLSWLSATRLCNALSAAHGLPPYFKYLTPQGEQLATGESPSEAEFEAGGWLVCADESAQRSFRLPTSSEWCYAASAGHPTPYAGGDDPEGLAWSAHNSGSKLHPVASLQPNAWGLYDMSGLLWEWCEDGSRDADLLSQSVPGGLRPLCASATQPKWLLGGSWANHPWVFPLGERLSELPTYADEFMGVRVVCGVAREEPQR